jgi:hypothetical protein
MKKRRCRWLINPLRNNLYSLGTLMKVLLEKIQRLLLRRIRPKRKDNNQPRDL